jgi:hypothetical protein
LQSIQISITIIDYISRDESKVQRASDEIFHRLKGGNRIQVVLAMYLSAAIQSVWGCIIAPKQPVPSLSRISLICPIKDRPSVRSTKDGLAGACPGSILLMPCPASCRASEESLDDHHQTPPYLYRIQ